MKICPWIIVIALTLSIFYDPGFILLGWPGLIIQQDQFRFPINKSRSKLQIKKFVCQESRLQKPVMTTG